MTRYLTEEEKSLVALCLRIAAERFAADRDVCAATPSYDAAIARGSEWLASQFERQRMQAEQLASEFEDADSCGMQHTRCTNQLVVGGFALPEFALVLFDVAIIVHVALRICAIHFGG